MLTVALYLDRGSVDIAESLDSIGATVSASFVRLFSRLLYLSPVGTKGIYCMRLYKPLGATIVTHIVALDLALPSNQEPSVYSETSRTFRTRVTSPAT